MTYLALAWQLPAIFTAVPMTHRLLPFKLPVRAIPLFYVIVSMIVMALPTSICLALGAAGVVSYIHAKIGAGLSDVDPPDMREVANHVSVAWDWVSVRLPVSWWPPTWQSPEPGPGDDSPEDDPPPDDPAPYQAPPRPPPGKITRRIPSL